MECTQCGREIPEDSGFCRHCGADVNKPAEAVPPPAPNPPPPVPPPAAAPPPPPSPAPGGASLIGPKSAPAPSANPAPGASPATGVLVLNFANFRDALNLILGDVGNFLGLGLAVHFGTVILLGLCIVPVFALASPLPFLGVLVGAALFVIVGVILPFTAYAVLVRKLRTGVFDWSAWGRGFSRYFAAFGQMLGLQVVALAPMFVYTLITGTSLLGVARIMRQEAIGFSPGLGGRPSYPGMGPLLLAPLGLVFLVAQVWWLARLFFSSGLVLLGNRSASQAISESLAATAPMQKQVLIYGLAMAGVFVGVGIVEGILGQIPGVNAIVFTLLGALLMMWQWLVIWMVYRDNYGLGEAE